MAVDGETLFRGYVLTEFLWQRCEIFRPRRPLVQADPQGAEWDLTAYNCPFYHKESRGLDEVFLAGRQDQDLVFTTEVLYLPIDVEIDQDHWVREVTHRADGMPVRNFGRWFGVRGNPSWYEAKPGGMDDPYLIVMCSMEARAPMALEALVAGSALFLDGTTSAGSLAGVL